MKTSKLVSLAILAPLFLTASCASKRDWMAVPDPIPCELSLERAKQVIQETAERLNWQIDSKEQNRMTMHYIVTAAHNTNIAIEFDLGNIRLVRLDKVWFDPDNPPPEGAAPKAPERKPYYVDLANALFDQIRIKLAQRAKDEQQR